MVQRALDDSDKNKAALIAKLQSRASFSEKMHKHGMTIEYSPDDDYLTITLGAPGESVSVPSAEGVYLLVDPDSGELNALEIPFFQETYQQGNLKGEFWKLAAEWLEAGHTTVHIPPRWEERAEEAFRDLIPA
jgi:hypothetical protein